MLPFTKTKILLLWAPLADYMVACFKELASKNDVELHLVYQPNESNAPYDPFDLSFCTKVFVYAKEREHQIKQYCEALSPDIIMMSSWNYPFYMSISKQSRKKGSYVVSSFDGQWRSTLKQRIGRFVSPFFLKPAIDNFFVPGDRQADFARKLGYKNPLQGYYAAKTKNFNVHVDRSSSRKFIFVGRLVPVKGIENLIAAYRQYRQTVDKPWDLIIVGKGELKRVCEAVDGVELKEFVQPQELPGVLRQASCLVLPSVFEPWGVVIHEAVTSGLTVICSFACGASTMFVRDGQNGYIVNHDEQSLVEAMQKMSGKSDLELDRMGATSRLLGSLWTTEKWADYVYQNICLPVKKPA